MTLSHEVFINEIDKSMSDFFNGFISKKDFYPNYGQNDIFLHWYLYK